MTACDLCGALLREDTQFTMEARISNQPQRRYVCAAGHSVYTGLPPLAPPPPPAAVNATRRRKVCRYCTRPFFSKGNGVYCRTRCREAALTERNRARGVLRRTGPKMTGEALRQARAVKFPNKARKSLVPYAARPQGLSKAWV